MKPRHPRANRAGADRMMASSIAGALAVAAVALALSASGGAAEPRLLEPERAFALSVQAVDEKTVEVRFVIANGYYLYREKMKFAVEPAVLAADPQLPPGALKDDPFFGAVETYRDRFALRLPLAGVDPGRKVTVRAESQGCADAGVCYPPQVQSVTVTLPAPGGRPGAPVAATPARKSWFN